MRYVCVLSEGVCLLFNRYAGILSAYGMALADVVHEEQEPCAKIYNTGKYLHCVPCWNNSFQKMSSEQSIFFTVPYRPQINV